MPKKGYKLTKEHRDKVVKNLQPFFKIGHESYHTDESRQKISKKLFERDNFICQQCNVKGNILNAHHVKGWTKYPKLRYEVENGLTLCYQCHRGLHSKKYS